MVWRIWPILVLAVPLFAGCAHSVDRAAWTQTAQMTARVVALDPEQRVATFRVFPETYRLRFAPDAPGFDQLQRGDRLLLRFHDAVVLQAKRHAGPVDPGIVEYHVGDLRRQGTQVAFVRVVTFAAEYLGRDHRSNLATLRLQDGRYRDVLVPVSLRSFVSSLAPGDWLDVSLEQAVSVALPSRR